MCMIRANWLNPAEQRCGNKASLPAALFLQACGALQKWPHKQPTGKQESDNIVLKNVKSMPLLFTLRAKINLTESGWLASCRQGQNHRWMGWGGSHVWHCSSVSQTWNAPNRDKRTQVVSCDKTTTKIFQNNLWIKWFFFFFFFYCNMQEQ